jgi:hypothetical protein
VAAITKHFEDILAFADYAKNAPSSVPRLKRTSRETGSYRATFTGGTQNYEQAHQLALAGWPEGCARVQEIAGEHARLWPGWKATEEAVLCEMSAIT